MAGITGNRPEALGKIKITGAARFAITLRAGIMAAGLPNQTSSEQA